MSQTQPPPGAGNSPGRPDRSAYVIPRDAPVLPSLASRGKVELVVKDDGSAVVLHDVRLDEPVHWVEFDADLDLMTFVTHSGKIFGLGLPVPPRIKRDLRKAESLFIIYMRDGEHPVNLDNVVLVVRHVGI